MGGNKIGLALWSIGLLAGFGEHFCRQERQGFAVGTGGNFGDDSAVAAMQGGFVMPAAQRAVRYRLLLCGAEAKAVSSHEDSNAENPALVCFRVS